MRGREGGEGRRPHSVGRVFLIHPGAAGRPIIQMGNQAQTGEAQGHVSTELQRGDVNTTLQTPKRLLGPRQPLPPEALHFKALHSSCPYFTRNPPLLLQKFLPETTSQGAQRQKDQGRGFGFGGMTGRARDARQHPRVTRGAACPRGSRQVAEQ